MKPSASHMRLIKGCGASLFKLFCLSLFLAAEYTYFEFIVGHYRLPGFNFPFSFED